jgi:hypothetical protein
MNTVREEALRAIRKANRGVLTPELVVKAAENPLSPLHGAFEWDDAKLAHQHRLFIARKLIAQVRWEVRVETHTFTAVPAYVRDPGQPYRTQGYVALAEASPQENRLILLAELARVEAAIIRSIRVAAATVPGTVKALEILLNSLLLVSKRVKQTKSR